MSNTPAPPSAPSHGPGRNPDSLPTPDPAGARRNGDTAADTPPHQGLPPVWREDARILLLGSFPGNASFVSKFAEANTAKFEFTIYGVWTSATLAARILLNFEFR